MIEFIAILAMGLVALAGLTCAARYFWRIDTKRALGYAAFALLVFCIFWLSGLWETESRHSWGSLTPIFFLIMAASGAVVLIVRRLLLKSGVFVGKDKQD